MRSDGLQHVRWIGGPPDSGKSTVAEMIANRFGLQWYRMDQFEQDHIARAQPDRHPLHVALREQLAVSESGFFESWVTNDAPTLAAYAHAIWVERLDLIADDLRNPGSDDVCIAEGPAFFPEALVPMLDDPGHAIWLVSSESFKRESHARRAKTAWRTTTSNPDLAIRHHIERDLLFADRYRQELETLHLPWIDIDGRESAAQIADRVAHHFELA